MLIVCPHCLTTNRVPDARLQDAPTCGHCGRELLAEAPVALDDASFDKVVARTGAAGGGRLLGRLVRPVHRRWRRSSPKAAAQLRGRRCSPRSTATRSPQTSAKFAIRSIPTCCSMKGGREVRRQPGATQASADRRLGRRPPPETAAARYSGRIAAWPSCMPTRSNSTAPRAGWSRAFACPKPASRRWPTALDHAAAREPGRAPGKARLGACRGRQRRRRARQPRRSSTWRAIRRSSSW